MLKSVTILLPFLICLFWGILFLVNRKQNSRSQNIWAVVTVLIMVTSAIIAYYWQPGKSYSLFYKLDVLDCFVTLSYIPFIYLYFREVTGDQSRLGWKMTLLFLPPVLVGLAVAFVFCPRVRREVLPRVAGQMMMTIISSARNLPGCLPK